MLLRSEVAGVPVTVHERFDAERLARAAPPGASVSLVPAMLARLVRTGADLGRFGAILVGGGGSIPKSATAPRRSARIVETYGLTETSGGVVYDGVPFAGTEVRIGDGGRIEVRGRP